MLHVLAATQATDTGSPWNLFIMVALFIAFFYFVMFRPENSRRKKLQQMRSSLQKGDVVIAMGIRATVEEIKERTVILKQVDGSLIEMLSQAITEVEPKEEMEKKQEPSTNN